MPAFARADVSALDLAATRAAAHRTIGAVATLLDGLLSPATMSRTVKGTQEQFPGGELITTVTAMVSDRRGAGIILCGMAHRATSVPPGTLTTRHRCPFAVTRLSRDTVSTSMMDPGPMSVGLRRLRRRRRQGASGRTRLPAVSRVADATVSGGQRRGC